MTLQHINLHTQNNTHSVCVHGHRNDWSYIDLTLAHPTHVIAVARCLQACTGRMLTGQTTISVRSLTCVLMLASSSGSC